MDDSGCSTGDGSCQVFDGLCAASETLGGSVREADDDQPPVDSYLVMTRFHL